MKISELKQPYRRMAEYLAEKNTYTRFKNKEILNDSFDWYETNVIFWLDIADGDYPPITEEIKKHFPPDFDFSVDVNEKVNLHKELFDKENQRKIEDEKYPERYPSTQCDEACYYNCTEGGKIKPKCINEKYTQLAKEGKFDELPDTCEFSEPVNLQVCDNEFMEPVITNVLGKFKNRYVTEAGQCWNYAKTITKN